MVKVAGLWELGYNTPLLELDLWQYPLREFGVGTLIMSPVTGLRAGMLQEWHELGEALAQERSEGNTVVFVDECGDTPMPEFDHPENVVYVFGKASKSAMAAYRQEGDLSVVIPTPGETGMLWPHQAAMIVLYDRTVKSWR